MTSKGIDLRDRKILGRQNTSFEVIVKEKGHIFLESGSYDTLFILCDFVSLYFRYLTSISHAIEKNM